MKCEVNRLYFGSLNEGDICWFYGRDVVAIRQVDDCDDDDSVEWLFELDHIDGTTYYIADLAVIEYTGEIRRLFDLYDRLKQLEENEG